MTTGHASDESTGMLYKAFPVDFKAIDEDGTIEGYGATFGNQDFVGDVIEKGAFSKAVRDNKRGAASIKMLWQHDYKQPIGTFSELKEDDNGLFVKGKIAVKSASGLNAYELIKAGAVDSLSIGFSATQWEVDAKTGIRTLKEIKLYEISPVTFPANPKAKIEAVKSAPQTIRDFESFLCDAGYSRSEAKRIACGGFNKQRDVALVADLKSLNAPLDGLLSNLKNLMGK